MYRYQSYILENKESSSQSEEKKLMIYLDGHGSTEHGQVRGMSTTFCGFGVFGVFNLDPRLDHDGDDIFYLA